MKGCKNYYDIRELEREYIKKAMIKWGWPREIIDLSEIQITDNGVTVSWKGEVPEDVRSEYLIDIEGEISCCWTCEAILKEIIEKLLSGKEVKIDEETVGLCGEYWEWLLERVLGSEKRRMSEVRET